MNLRPRRRQAVEINLAPLIDVVFLLLIFFMVSTTFKDDETRLRLQLPEAQGESIPPEEPPAMLHLVIDAAGNFYVQDQAVVDQEPATLVRALQGVLTARGGAGANVAETLPVLIQADAKTPHQAVMTALDAARTLGLSRVAFAAIQPAGQTP